MIALDTNVLSALMQSQPDIIVVSWLDRQPSESVWITTINLFEIRYGLAQLTLVKRWKALEDTFSVLLRDDLQESVSYFSMYPRPITLRD